VSDSEEVTDVTAVAHALDVDPQTVRADTPLRSLGWSGTAAEWAVVSDHLGLPIEVDPSADAQPATIGELIAIVGSIHRRSVSSSHARDDTDDSDDSDETNEAKG
jgi:hypothetical protein